MYAELSIAVDPDMNIGDGHKIAMDVQHELLHELKYLASASIHLDPADLSGSIYHRIDSHEHDDLPSHSH
jgi:divalent metal cation (Fe/Co/Zn/Cd) transporter